MSSDAYEKGLEALPGIRERCDLLRADKGEHCTAEPFFMVQQKRRVYGVCSEYADNYVWVDDENEEVSRQKAAALDRHERKHGDTPKGFHKLGYVEYWEDVTGAFTRKGAEDYLKCDGHNLKEPRIYVRSLHRNAEMIALRGLLKSGLLCDALEAAHAEIQRLQKDLRRVRAANAEIGIANVDERSYE